METADKMATVIMTGKYLSNNMERQPQEQQKDLKRNKCE